MRRAGSFLLILLAGACSADAQTNVNWGLQIGAEPRTLGVYDTSHTFTPVGALNSATHVFTLNTVAALPTGSTINAATIAGTAGTLTNGHCVSINSLGLFVDAGGTCTLGGGGGTVAAGTVGQLAEYVGTTAVGSFALAGDCSFSSGSITCTKTGGVAYAPSATTDTTNASNISSGTVNSARLPVAGVLQGAVTAQSGYVAATGLGSAANANTGSGVATALAAPLNATGGLLGYSTIGTPQAGYSATTGLGSAANYGVNGLAAVLPVTGTIFDVQKAYAGNVSAALTALNAAGGGTLYFAGGTTTTVAGANTIGANTSVLCGSGAVIQTTSATADVFNVTGWNDWIKGCSFSTSVHRTGGYYLNLNTGLARVDGVYMSDGFNGISFANGGVYTVSNSYMLGLNGDGIDCHGAGDAHVIGTTINNAWSFLGYIAGNQLYVTTPNPFHTLAAGDGLQGAITQGTYIVSGTSSPYTVNFSQTSGSAGSPISIDDAGAGVGIEVIGDGSAIGCAMTVTDSGILSGKYNIYLTAVSGLVTDLLVQNSYLDNATVNAVAIAPQSGGIVGYTRIKNSEIGPNTSLGSPVLISGATGSTILEVDISGNSIYSYAATNYGIQMAGVSPNALVLSGNTIGIAGGTLGYAFAFWQSGASNAVIVGNISKSTNGVYSTLPTDTSCIFANNKLNGAVVPAGFCHQSGNY